MEPVSVDFLFKFAWYFIQLNIFREEQGMREGDILNGQNLLSVTKFVDNPENDCEKCANFNGRNLFPKCIF